MVIRVVGLFLLFMGIFSTGYAFIFTDPQEIVWACYLSMILIGVGILQKNAYLVISQVNILGVPALIWNIDFWYIASTGKSLWGVADYFFFDNPPLVSQFISLQHIYTVPLALFTLFFIKIKKVDAWKLSSMQMALLFVVSRIFTSPARNLNCVFENCLPVDFGSTPYPVVWFLIMFLQIYLTNYGIVRILLRRKSYSILNSV